MPTASTTTRMNRQTPAIFSARMGTLAGSDLCRERYQTRWRKKNSRPGSEAAVSTGLELLRPTCGCGGRGSRRGRSLLQGFELATNDVRVRRVRRPREVVLQIADRTREVLLHHQNASEQQLDLGQ